MLLGVVLIGNSTFGAAGGAGRSAAAGPELLPKVAIPLANDDRLPDFNTYAVVMEMLAVPPARGADDSHGVLDGGIVLRDASYSDARLVLADSEIYILLGLARYARPALGRQPRLVVRPTAKPLPSLLSADVVQAMLTVMSPNEGGPTITVPAPSSTHMTLVDFTALLNAEGNVVLYSDDPDARQDVLVQRGRFSLGTLELGRSPATFEMDEARFAVSDRVYVMPKGRIVTHIRSAPAGLDLSADVVLDIRRGGKIILLWHGGPNVEGIHWGMRAKGDWRVQFRYLIEAGRIIVGKLENGVMAISKAVIIFDGVYTYITIDIPVYDKPINSRALEGYADIERIPEPATILLLSLGGLAALRRRRASIAR